ncbi:PVC-type heme-binding CxxCH protein [Roseiconus lacunae]|uniref:PVC-type heme-binding CxxCH protein n=1 Tax=Roseiconus lacunae TaxID=2605694 RepID=UPI0030937B51|nr:PVC-type heme-binding CxxCH protein [Stieleria sp. HD01]
MIRFSLAGLAIAFLLGSGTFSWAQLPKLADDRLQLTLYADSSEIVTPIGMVIDQRDRMFVIESHTHHPPSDYAGPKSDRIKIFVDEDNNGKPDSISIFADGIHQAMNLAISPDGDLFVVCAREVLRLVDDDNDGKCERKEQVLRLVTEERYAHNCLLGITFDREGWMYVARGNTGSRHYRFEGSDTSMIEGYGDGGSVVRCRDDGSELEEFATGFWNPFDLKFDGSGRLLLVDNDPDARGPNRLVHVVRGGDYGYKSLYGGGGNHPFQGWDGSLAGTLPFIAGTGEAPCGLIDCKRASLPSDYQESLLVTIWNENSIERFDVQSNNGTITATGRRPFLTGAKDFRPVAIDSDTRGNLFVTDWMLVDYPNHGHGRIWRITCKPEVTPFRPRANFSDAIASDEVVRPTSFSASDTENIAASLESGHPFVSHAVQMRLADESLRELRDKLANHRSQDVRLGALLSAKRANIDEIDYIRRFLKDESIDVRRAALMWAGESMREDLRSDLEIAIHVGAVDANLFETYLAAVENLSGSFADGYRRRSESRAKELRRELPNGLLGSIARDPEFPDSVRAHAVSRLTDAQVEENLAWLIPLVTQSKEPFSVAIIRRLISVSAARSREVCRLLTQLAIDDSMSDLVRCEALFTLSHFQPIEPSLFLPLLHASEEDIAIEAARTFRSWLDAGLARDCLKKIKALDLSEDVRERISPALGQEQVTAAGHSLTADEWIQRLTGKADALRGRRVFHTHRVGCSACHSIGNRGGTLGPDLGRVAESKSRKQIIDSILNPSAEFTPQYQAWMVVTVDGEIHRGLQLDHKAGGKINLTLDDGSTRTYAADEIEDYIASPNSLMPRGLEKTMTIGEFRDLVEYLIQESIDENGTSY